MNIIIENNKTIRLAQVFEQQEEVIYKHFSLKDPKFRYIKSMAHGNWDGWHRKYNKNAQTLRRPFLQELIELCHKHDFPYEITDLREKSKYPRPSFDSFDDKLIDGITLRDYQVRALQSVCVDGKSETNDFGNQEIISETGIHAAKTGGGKTEIAAGICKLFRCPTVIITEQTVVLSQIAERLKLRNVVHNNDIGMFCAGQTPNNNLVIIGSIQATLDPKKPDRNNFDVKSSFIIKELNRMLENDYNGLVKMIGENCVLAWKKSLIVDRFNNINKKTPLDIKWSKGKWEDGEFIKWANDNQNIFNNKEKELWNSVKDYDRLLNKTLLIFKSYITDKLFDAAMKGYATRVERSQMIQNLISKCELLLIDECDKASSDNYKKLFNKIFTGRYQYGFSSTPFDPSSPVANLNLRERFGPILSTAERDELTEKGAIQPIKYYMVKYGDHNPGNKIAYDVAEKEYIIDNKDFHEKVKKICDSFPNEGTLIIVDTNNIEDIGKALEKHIPGSVFISGQTTVKKRNEAIKEFEARKIRVLIGSKIIKRGLDLAGGCENLILVGGGKKWSNIDQIVGRAVRKTKRGWSRIFDFYFTNSFYLQLHSRRRLKFLIEMGYPTTILYNGKPIDGRLFVSNKYRIK